MHPLRYSCAAFVILTLYITGCEKSDSSTNSQLTGKIVGMITDARYNQPVVGATVTTSPTTETVTSDTIGQYVISKIAAGHYTVTAIKIGYAPGSVDVIARSDTLVWGNLKLTPQ